MPEEAATYNLVPTNWSQIRQWVPGRNKWSGSYQLVLEQAETLTELGILSGEAVCAWQGVCISQCLNK